MPRFSIIAVHYQGVIPHERFLRGISSLLNQTFKDYEILCYHDGPLLEKGVDSPVPIRSTAVRFNDWGHSLRDIGIRDARGEYILHFNADNVLYPNALATIESEIARSPRIIDEKTGAAMDTNDIILFPIALMGRQAFRGRLYRKPDESYFVILNAHPPSFCNIDCMQLVMKRELWLKEGGWRDRGENGDGRMYAQFCKKYGYRTAGPVLGEHW